MAVTSRHLVVFADNASVHHAKMVKTHLGSKVTLLFNAAYSPMLNPFEEFFKFKKLLRKMPTSNELELIESIQKTLKLFSLSDFKGYITHILHFIEESLEENDLF